MNNRAVAALEFAICVPILLVMMVYGFELNQVQNCRIRLAQSLHAASEYVFLQGNPNKLAVMDLITKFAKPTGHDIVEVSIHPTHLYCVNTAGRLTIAAGDGSVCLNGSVAAHYMVIDAAYHYRGVLSNVDYTGRDTVSIKLD